ncbi:MAG: hypothetical protein R3E08_02485 [Thiotrichaceae bacterium]
MSKSSDWLFRIYGRHALCAVMPIEVRQVLKQLLKGEVRAGVSVAADSGVTFITHAGRWVLPTITVLHDGVLFDWLAKFWFK